MVNSLDHNRTNMLLKPTNPRQHLPEIQKAAVTKIVADNT